MNNNTTAPKQTWKDNLQKTLRRTKARLQQEPNKTLKRAWENQGKP